MQVLADFLLLIVSFALTGCFKVLLTAVRHRPLDYWSLSLPPAATGVLLLYGAVFTLLGYSERLYHPETEREPRQQTVVLAKVIFWSTVLVCIGCVTAGITRLSIFTLMATAPVNFVVMLVYRHERQRILAQGRNASRKRNVLIVGAGPVGRRVAYTLQQDSARKRVIRGFLDQSQPVAGDVLGRVEDLATIARREFVDEIILAISPHSDVARRAIAQARRNRIDVKLVPDLLGADPAQVMFERFGGMPVLTLCEEQIPVFGLLLKRIVDVLLSATALLLAAPVLAAIVFAIKLDSPGPVLYRATRMGLKGRRFLCYKFRTMVTDADKLKEKLRQRNEREGAFFKMNDDPRITRVGKALRRYSLDELPQLWNVLRGEMSLVGPRPHPLDDVQRYQLEDLQRLEVTPGLTGLWQVTARRDPSFQRSVALDREYIGYWSLRMDFWILCKTVGAVLRGEGT
ncbi:MAG TPA: sugar transferase [Terriglobales bacterium]|nr:sugar transferase [Terriglobales bacterium]